MRRLYSFARIRTLIVFFIVVVLWNYFNTSSISFGGEPSYEMQTTPVNGAIIMERRPILRWLVFPNGTIIDKARLLLDGKDVPLQQVASDDAVALTYQPAADLIPGSHTLGYILEITGFQAITLSSEFIIVDKGPDLYGGKNRLKLADMEAEALLVLNNYRQTLGLSALLKNERLSMSAQAHANYQALNNAQGHYERPDTPGFTGNKPQDRAEFFGYTGRVGEGISFSRPIAGTGIDGLMDAPYHRLGHINPNFREVGIAFGWHPEQTIINYGTTGNFIDDRVMLYPYPGQLDVKIAWFAAEEPNPLARYGQDRVTVGYPISLSVHDDKTVELKTRSATLTDDGGRSVPFYLVDSSQEKDYKKHVFMIPVQSLIAGKTYTAAVSGARLQKDGTSIPLNRIWSFTTRAEFAIRHIGVITLRNNEYIEVITKNGDVPDLNYTLSRDGKKVCGYVGQEKKYYSYEGEKFENGEYSLEIASSSFLYKATYKVIISGFGEERKCTYYSI